MEPRDGRCDPGDGTPVGPDDGAPARPDVGDFWQGSPGSRWALARYLVGRAIAEYVSRALLVFGLLVLAVAVLVYFVAPTWIAVLIGLIALVVFAFRGLLGAVLRRFSGAAQFGPLEQRLRRLVRDTRTDVRTELRRVGVPSSYWSMPLLAVRLVGRRRAQTLQRLSRFDLDLVVPQSRLDDLHMLVRSVLPPGTAGPV